MNITFVTCLHGNERVPSLALQSAGIPHIIGNPEALRRNVRFVDSDLNAAFGCEAMDAETRRARDLLTLIPEDTFVVDFHSYDTDSGPFAIIVDPRMEATARMTGLKRIVYMKMSVKEGHALINFRKGVSIETGMHDSAEAFDTSVSVATRMIDPKQYAALDEVELYEVFGKIETPGTYVDFTLHPDGYYPVFANKNQYDTYGLKAKKVESFSLE